MSKTLDPLFKESQKISEGEIDQTLGPVENQDGDAKANEQDPY